MEKIGTLDDSDVKFMYFVLFSLTVLANLKHKDKVVPCSCTVICRVSYSGEAGHACYLAYLQSPVYVWIWITHY